MFGKRELQVKVVKRTDDMAEAIEDVDFEDKIAIVGDVVKDIMLEAGKLYVGYVFLDTFRKVVITMANRPL